MDNFGGEEDSTGNGVFTADDFDEGHLEHYVWDLRRAAVSIVLAGQKKTACRPEVAIPERF